LFEQCQIVYATTSIERIGSKGSSLLIISSLDLGTRSLANYCHVEAGTWLQGRRERLVDQPQMPPLVFGAIARARATHAQFMGPPLLLLKLGPPFVLFAAEHRAPGAITLCFERKSLPQHSPSGLAGEFRLSI